jgi:hypothetical protein
VLDIDYHNIFLLKKSVGCTKSNNTGYAGRMRQHELLHGSDGMTTLKQDGILKVFNDDCDLRSVLTVCTI